MANCFPVRRALQKSPRKPLQVLAGAFALSFALTSTVSVRAQNAAPDITTKQNAAPEITDDAEARAWEEARVSLQLKQVPLSQMLWLLGAQSAVRFRYATVPDMETSVELKDALLRPTLRDVLATLGFRVQPSALGRIPFTTPTLWVARENRLPALMGANTQSAGNSASNARKSAQNLVAALAPKPQVATPTWQMWTKVDAPDINWMRPAMPAVGAFSGTVGPNGQTLKFDSKNSASEKPTPGVPGLDPVGVRVQWRGTGAREESGWSTLDFALDETPARPGVQMKLPDRLQSTDGSVRLRWPLELRRVPPRVQLWLETDRTGAFYVNGARMLSWTGARRLDLSSVLQSGTNILAIVWSAPSDKNAPEQASPVPQLRYEWLAGE